MLGVVLFPAMARLQRGVPIVWGNGAPLGQKISVGQDAVIALRECELDSSGSAWGGAPVQTFYFSEDPICCGESPASCEAVTPAVPMIWGRLKVACRK